MVIATITDDSRYLSLTTYRRSGAGVATPVWFATVDDHLYVFTSSKAGKVKRLRHSSGAAIAPCDMRGKVRRDVEDVNAYLVEDAAEEARAYAALREKYGWQLRLTDLLSTLTGRIRKRQMIRIEV